MWERLLAQAPDDWTLLANVRLTTRDHDHELDLIVLMPGAGVVVAEVKGGTVFVDHRGWRQGHARDARATRAIRPVDQARTGKYALREYIEADPRWSWVRSSRIRFGHTVVMPYSRFDADFSLPECPRWMVHDRDDQDDLAGRLHDIATQQETAYRPPTPEDCDLIVSILQGRNLPVRDVAAAAAEREAYADRLTLEQATLLGVTRLLSRVEVRGGAGSGKTTLAITQARDLTRGRFGERSPKRVALLCYSIGLASFFKRVTHGDGAGRPAFVGTFEEFARCVGVAEFGTRDDSGFWEEELPRQMAALAADLPDERKFDAFVVDEAQDFADSWWAPIITSLRDQETGGLFLYSDENQRVFARFGSPPVPLVPLVLDHNLRNTRQIAEAFAPLAPMRMRAQGGDGPDVRFVPTSTGDALVVADDQIDGLLGEGWQPQDIALLTTGKRHPEQTRQQESAGQDGYWQSFWDDELVFFGHVLGCKGLERRVVVLCLNDSPGAERAREKLYVGLSRATDLLVVVGDPAAVVEIGGPDVAQRLGIPC